MINKITAKQLIDIFIQAEKAVTAKKEMLNNLNVYPVPDGDTGTNMSLTLKEIVSNIDLKKDYDIKKLSEIITESSLMGGRGNSGVILSQFLGGFCSIIKSKDSIDKTTLHKAFEKGTEEAYNSLSNPVEGTILTVMKAASKQVGKKLELDNITRIIGSAIHESQFTLQKTPDMLQKLKDAGVVDAGGAGFVYFLEGFYEAISDEEDRRITATDDFSSPKLARIWEETGGVFGMGGIRMLIDFNLRFLKFTLKNFWWLIKKAWEVIKIGRDYMSVKKAFRLFSRLSEQLKWQNIKKANISISKLLNVWQEVPEDKYCCEVILTDVKDDVDTIKKKISEIDGKSAIVAKTGKITKLHFHGKNKTRAQELFKKLGKIKKSKFEDIQLQHKEFISKKVSGSEEDKSGSAVIAVVNGNGFKNIYKSFENVFTILGGATMNPSVSDFNKVINKINFPNIIIIPNNKNVFLAAEKAAKQKEKDIKVLKTYDQAQGLAALLNFNSLGKLNENYEMMKNGLELVNTFSITKSTRDTSVSGKKVMKGDMIAIDSKGIITKGENAKTIIENAIKKLGKNFQLLTLYYGETITKEKAYKLKNSLAKKYKCETQVYEGGQPHYSYIVALE